VFARANDCGGRRRVRIRSAERPRCKSIERGCRTYSNIPD
jgi:hypothetical protein